MAGSLYSISAAKRGTEGRMVTDDRPETTRWKTPRSWGFQNHSLNSLCRVSDLADG